jgi:DNA-binding CsgD family transcriptional regulator
LCLEGIVLRTDASANIVDRIYEAAAVPELWPAVLQDLAETVQAFGMHFAHRTVETVTWTMTENMGELTAAYLAGGWNLRPDDRAVLLLNEQYPGFRTESDYWPEDEQEELPLYRDFLIPRGFRASAASFLQGTHDDALLIGLEGFASRASARSAIPVLDGFRPHLARAISLSVQLRQAQLDASMKALDVAGIGAAVVSPDGRLRAVSDRFAERLGEAMSLEGGRLRFADRFLHAQFAEALLAIEVEARSRSIGVAPVDDRAPFAIHLLPLRLGARDVFGWDGVLLLLAEPHNASVPNADLLRLLFDLTPAEARLSRLIGEGRSLAEASRALRIAEATARVHLRSVFLKTGVTRQAELVRLLVGLRPPDLR